jgi:hypothetical protein
MSPSKGTLLTVIGLVIASLGLLWPGYQLTQALGYFQRPEEITFYGYFRDINKDGNIYTGDEVMVLKFAKLKDANVKSVTGESRGTVLDERGGKVPRMWQMRGYRAGDKLVLTYFTAHDGKASRSGVCYLKEYGETFRGHWASTDTFSGKNVVGAYILTQSSPLKAEDADKELDLIQPPMDLLPQPKSPN